MRNTTPRVSLSRSSANTDGKKTPDHRRQMTNLSSLSRRPSHRADFVADKCRNDPGAFLRVNACFQGQGESPLTSDNVLFIIEDRSEGLSPITGGAA